MTDREYIMYEMNKARVSTGYFRVKVTSDTGESRWVHIPAERFDAVLQSLTGDDA